MDTATHAAGTRERLLQVASELFANKGYAATSISEITRLAGANKASVNYHFHSKENLYREAWGHAHDRLSERFPEDGGVGGDRPAEERLRGRIRGALQRAMLGGTTEFRIMRNEMANPTGLLRQIVDVAIRPLREKIQVTLGELLGPRATSVDIELCEVCVVSPWIHVCHRQVDQCEGLVPVFHEDVLEEMVEHFTAYALAGIRQIRRQIEQSGGEERALTRDSGDE